MGRIIEQSQPLATGSRLKRSSTDLLEEIGLVSKGDNRLLDFETQEIYYARIVDSYAQCYARPNEDESLNKVVAAVSLEEVDVMPILSSKKPAIKASPFVTTIQPARELSIIMMAMRKMREAIVASSRTDLFAQKAYIFIIRAAILSEHMESYHPAILHLLQKIHPFSPLSKLEHHEFIGYHILDLACRQNDLAQAYDVRNRYDYRDILVEMALSAIVHDNWYNFWNAHRSADDYQKSLIEWRGDKMRKHVVKCFGRSYFAVDKLYIEKSTARSWEYIQKECSLGWKLNGEVVAIKMK